MELRDVLRMLRAHWIGLVALILLGGLASYGYAMLQPRVYTASSTGFVTVRSDNADAGTTMVSTQIARDQVASFVDIGTWRSVAEYAIKTLNLQTTPEALVSHVSVANPADTVFVTVSAPASDPQATRDLAEAWVAVDKRSSLMFPAVIIMLSGRPRPSQTRCSLVVSPPRERPIP